MSNSTFDPEEFKARTQKQWDEVAEGWHRWSPMVRKWSAPATEIMFELAGVREGARAVFKC